MKKLLILAAIFALIIALASCTSTDQPGNDNQGENETPEHTHDFVLDSTTKATCEADGEELYKCECGEEQRTPIPATGHNVQLVSSTAPTCTRKGSDTYRCTYCGGMNETVEHAALGHDYSATDEPSRFAFCTRSNCVRRPEEVY